MNERCPWIKKDGERCQKPCINGSTVCYTHGGNLPPVRVAAKRRIETAEIERRYGRTVERYGAALDITPSEALDMSLGLTAGVVQFLAAELQRVGHFSEEGPDGRVRPTVAATMYESERKNLVVAAKAAADAGVAERKLEQSEIPARLVSMALAKIIEALSLSPEQRDLLPVVVPRVLAQLPTPQDVLEIFAIEESTERA